MWIKLQKMMEKMANSRFLMKNHSNDAFQELPNEIFVQVPRHKKAHNVLELPFVPTW